MKIEITLVAYALSDELVNLYESLTGPDTRFHVFLHSQQPDVIDACQAIARNRNVKLYEYGYNRGLARSWNDGLIASQHADVMMIANDDVLATRADMFSIAESAYEHPECYMVSGFGLDMQTEEKKDMRFALAAVNPIAIERIGYFDPNFFPIYFEDIDWYYRASLAGLKRLIVGGTHLIHLGSQSRLTNAANNAQHEITFARNRDYYGRKWGGHDQGDEHFTLPFANPAFSLRISEAERDAPYPGFDRDDTDIVTV